MIYFVRRPTPGPADETARPDAPGTTEPSGPPAGLFLTEPLRGLFDLAALLVAAPWLATAPRGDGHGVLVLPGLLASDTSTLPLRVYPVLDPSAIAREVRGVACNVPGCKHVRRARSKVLIHDHALIERESGTLGQVDAGPRS